MPTSQALASYFSSRADALTAATRTALRVSGQDVAREANRQLRSNFKRKAGNARARFYAQRGTLPDAVIVSIKPLYLNIFEEGGTVKGDRFLVIPIAPFRRIGKRGWGLVYAALKRQYKVKIIPARDGYLVTADGQPAYKLQRQVEVPKRLDLAGQVQRIGASIPDRINSLLES